MADNMLDLRNPMAPPSWIGAVTTVIGDRLLVARSFRDHPTQRIEGPNRRAFVVEVRSPVSTARPDETAKPSTPRRAQAWAVEVSAPGPDGLGPVVVRESHRSQARSTRRARAIRRAIRRGEFVAAIGS